MGALKAVSGIPAAPAHLTTSAPLWRSVTADWRLEAHELELLRLACEAIDRAEQARQAIERVGLLVEGRYGLRTHPAVAVERDARLAAARLFRQLSLEPPPPPVDRMALRSRRGRG